MTASGSGGGGRWGEGHRRHRDGNDQPAEGSDAAQPVTLERLLSGDAGQPGDQSGDTLTEGARVVGRALRAAREQRGLSLEEMQQRTQIRKSHLQALEAGDLSRLPEPTFVIGFLRIYTRSLDLSEPEFLATLMDPLNEQRQRRGFNRSVFLPPTASRQRPARWVVIGGMALYLA
ncbi:MAG: helix-turn-helix domain-containing protein, partial [Magnetococcales bacterium]|nr:helix-turn-helix domain-containing protein [Magnetococcales bacterium]